jgi:metal-sulfur cluster biosynthetic enzyme
LDFDEGEKKLYCAMTLTTQFCPMGEFITNAVKENLQLSFPAYESAITLTFDPPWNHEMISAEGREFLNN